MKLRECNGYYYTTLPKSHVNLFGIRRYDKINVIPHRFQQLDREGNVVENCIELLIIVSKGYDKINPVRPFARFTIPKNLVETLFQWKAGQVLTPVLYSQDERGTILKINEYIKVSRDIPEFLNLSFKSVLSRIKRMRRRRPEAQEKEWLEPYSCGFQSDVEIKLSPTMTPEAKKALEDELDKIRLPEAVL